MHRANPKKTRTATQKTPSLRNKTLQKAATETKEENREV